MFSKRKTNIVRKTRQRRGVRPSWAGGTAIQMLQRSSEADNVLLRLPPGPDYSGASSSGSVPSWFCRDQLLPLSHLTGLICPEAQRSENIFMLNKIKCDSQKCHNEACKIKLLCCRK